MLNYSSTTYLTVIGLYFSGFIRATWKNILLFSNHYGRFSLFVKKENKYLATLEKFRNLPYTINKSNLIGGSYTSIEMKTDYKWCSSFRWKGCLCKYNRLSVVKKSFKLNELRISKLWSSDFIRITHKCFVITHTHTQTKGIHLNPW